MMVKVEFAEHLDWRQIEHFDPEEFDDPDCPGSWKYMRAETVIYLNNLRERTGWAIITHNKFGVHGCVCMTKKHHSPSSYHNFDNPRGCSAVDWHFDTDADPREQAKEVLKSPFTGIGIYQNVWKWKGSLLPIGFHTDLRPRFQIWKYVGGFGYVYLLE